MERKGPPPGGHDPGWVPVPETAARLDLTAEQKAAILDRLAREGDREHPRHGGTPDRI